MLKRIKEKLFNLIREDDTNSFSANVFDGFIIGLIILNIILVILDTFSLPVWYKNTSEIIEIVSVIIFTLEYLARLWIADMIYPDKKPFAARIRYFFTFMALIDLVAILPFYLPFVFPIDLRVLRMLRILRLFRLFKMKRYVMAFTTIANVFRKKAHQLISSVFIVSFLMIISSVMMFNLEHDIQPEVFKNAFSGIWWTVETITTLGYGDIIPQTTLGQILGCIISLLGIGLLAVPTGIIAAGFIEETDTRKRDESDSEEKAFCPYCGHKLDK